MTRYIPSRNCQCPRCRANGLMGAVILITLGVLALLGEFSRIDFAQGLAVFLIVVGVMLYLGRSASMEGHVEPLLPGSIPPPPPPPIAGSQHGPEVSQ